MSDVEPAGPVNPAGRQPAGREQGAAGPAYRLPSPCLPQACSYDPADEKMATIHARMLSEPGQQPRYGQAWVGHVVAWWAGPWGLGGSPTKWGRVAPCVALLSCTGELIRVFGWDAFDTLARAILTNEPQQLAGGFDVHVRSTADPAGEHWWWVIDRLSPEGEINSEAISDGQQTTEGGPA